MECVLIHHRLFVRIIRGAELSVVYCINLQTYFTIWKISFIKNQKYTFTDLFGHHLTITNSFGKFAICKHHFEKNRLMLVAILVMCEYRESSHHKPRPVLRQGEHYFLSLNSDLFCSRLIYLLLILSIF